jgi:hypothetical protein
MKTLGLAAAMASEHRLLDNGAGFSVSLAFIAISLHDAVAGCDGCDGERRSTYGVQISDFLFQHPLPKIPRMTIPVLVRLHHPDIHHLPSMLRTQFIRSTRLPIRAIMASRGVADNAG